jgi:hypothetical protein
MGIKQQRLHTFLSAAFLASLGTTVLILYVMTPPVSDAIQGAYVVAIVCTGCVLGGAATVFPEITESMGCLLGGFCLSMWLLSLQDGGLLSPTASKVVFIACFTLAAFAFYFSHWTRTYALIGSTSFAGATAAVLGIDCFSRAGLKEFWAYIWALNPNLFPLGADTYPLTRGIRVELAATVIICLAGIISQLKLWRIVKERRAKRDAERAEGQRHLRAEDEAAGKQVEEFNAHERKQWEAVYGDRQMSADSGIGNLESEKRMRHSQGATAAGQQVQHDVHGPSEHMCDATGMTEIPLDDIPPPIPPKAARPAAEMVMSQDPSEGTVTVRVAQDEAVDNEPGREQNVWILGADGEARPASIRPKRSSKGSTVIGSPGIVPLPFKVPAVSEVEALDDDDRSSIATFADGDGDRSAVVSRRSSLAKRLSQGSAGLLRSLSQRSRRSVGGRPEFLTESWEDLVGPRPSSADGRGSVAATIDGMSDDGRETSYLGDDTGAEVLEVEAQLTAQPEAVGEIQQASSPVQPAAKMGHSRPISAAETVATSILNAHEVGSSRHGSFSPSNTTDLASKAENPSLERDTPETTTGASPSEQGTQRAKSVGSVESTPVSLSKVRLPRALSRIAMSYRTNEWAKHLSHAETPQPEALRLEEYPEELEQGRRANDERAAPVKTAELQQTAEDGAPAPATARSTSAMSNYPSTPSLPTQQLPRSLSTQSLGAVQSPESQARANNLPPSAHQNFPAAVRSMSGNLNRRASALVVETIAEEGDQEQFAGPVSPSQDGSSGSDRVSAQPYNLQCDRSASSLSLSRPPVPGVVSYSSPQTLLGRREILLRTKHGSFVNSSAPDLHALSTIPSRAASDAGSIYNFNAASTGALARSSGGLDLDDLPMSQRRDIMRQSSLMGLSATGSRPGSVIGFSAPAPAADAVPFDSHQPSRNGVHLPTSAAREAQLASFRSSVAADLRAGTPLGPSSGRETPLAMMATGARDGAVRQSIDMQRSYMMEQKEAAVQRKEAERLERERGDRAFEQRMRSGDPSLLEAHRDALRRMQAKASKGGQ